MEHKLGIIGYGYMGSWHHRNISERIEGLDVAAVYDIDPARLAVAKEAGLKTYDTLDAFLADDSFDIVLCATPNNVHKELVVAALDAGKHTISEKPAAMSAEELAEMIAASERNGKLFTAHQNRRWDRDYRMVMETLKAGKIGKPYTIESRVHGQRGAVFGWRADKAAGGGMMLDWGVHLIDQMMYMIDEPVVAVDCHMHSVKSEEVDDYFKLMMRFASGLSAQIEVGTYCLHQLPRWYANGDAGSIRIDDWACNGEIVTANPYSPEWKPEIVQTAAGPTRTMAPRPKETLSVEALPNVDAIADWTCYYRNVMAAIEGREELIVKPAQVMRVIKVMEACFESDKIGRGLKTNI